MNAIVVMAIGEKYIKLYEALKDQFVNYAAKCNADLVVCTAAPDPSLKRNILCQKMLIPHQYKQYEWIAFLDLDVLISNNAPSIFKFVDDTKAFAAVVDIRKSKKFENVVNHHWCLPSILSETHLSYFESRGFPTHTNNHASINGGAWLCNPNKIADKFNEFYYSDFSETPHEEAMMAYVAQSNDLFFELDYKFNTQLIYEIYKTANSPAIKTIKSIYFRLLFKLNNYIKLNFYMYPPAYRKLVSETLSDSYIVHFAGNFPFINSFKNKCLN